MRKIVLPFMTVLFVLILGCSPYEKHEETVTKIVSYDELYWMERNQRELANKLSEENNIAKTMIEEIREGSVMLRFNLDFMEDHPEYDLVEFEFPITKYKKERTSIEFFNDEGKITKVHSVNGDWEVY
ncbi:hypothetical protein [Bacillus suaedaesalsae]|uniref:DUF4878 domain-containing protein n=1 Tax=Bacillus suaedaesalsae TaxID=2810349 RepID=A0ABS2DP85_9BACI|nr:hypothetical protein [Bacillus suaedaesalsae]MBM6619438.1 hypothetical protein [Bacillus suaedaesalsae]